MSEDHNPLTSTPRYDENLREELERKLADHPTELLRIKFLGISGKANKKASAEEKDGFNVQVT